MLILAFLIIGAIAYMVISATTRVFATRAEEQRKLHQAAEDEYLATIEKLKNYNGHSR